MPIYYDFYESPKQPGHERGHVHARVQSTGTLSTDALLERICEGSRNDKNDLHHALMRVVDELKIAIAQGYRVHIDELGYFSPQLATIQPKDKRYKNPIVLANDLNFTCEKSVKQSLIQVNTIRVEKSHKSAKGIDHEALDETLRQHFASRPTITRKELQIIYPAISRTSLCAYLKQCVSDGKLLNVGTKNSPVYMKGEKL